MTIEKLQTHKVNVTVKVDRDEKVRIDTIANKLQMNRSTYLRNLLFRENHKMNILLDLPNELIIQPEEADAAKELIERLQKKYSGKTGSELILGALKIALKNENNYLSFKLTEVL